MPEQTPVIVHLVHGTWPFGLFRTNRGKRPKVWFEDGSTVRNRIACLTKISIQFETFQWSGKNSFSARREASDQFVDHLTKLVQRYPESRHVIVAHSHGGTVVHGALARMPDFHLDAKVFAVICMSTPFTYLSWSGSSRRRLLAVAISGFVNAILLNVGLLSSSIRRLAGFYLGLPAVGIEIVIFLVLTTLIIYGWPRPPEATSPYLVSTIPIVLLRATRDEVALLTGFTQGIEAFIGFLLRTVHSAGSFFSIRQQISRGFLVISIVLVMSLLIRFPLLFSSDVPLYIKSVFIPETALGIYGFLYLVGYLIVAFCVGLNWRYWADSIIEVDVAPPGRACAFKAYFDLKPLPSLSLRHGLYDLSQVQEDIAKIIRQISTLASGESSISTRLLIDAFLWLF